MTIPEGNGIITLEVNVLTGCVSCHRWLGPA